MVSNLKRSIFFFRWDIKALLKAIPKLGAVIDLTNTARYYNPNVSYINSLLELI